MKAFMKKMMILATIFMVLVVSGCSKDSKEETKEVEEVVEEVELVKNNRYVEPVRPSNVQKIAFNDLTQAVEQNKDRKPSQEEAKQVAINFVYDFFTMKNKESRNDIGGLQFIPSDSIRKYMEFSQSYYYGNYATIVNEYGKKALPEVTNVEVVEETPASFTYNDTICDGYKFRINATYADTKIGDENLKKEMVVSVMQIHDFDFSRDYDYKKRNLVFKGEMKKVYRVVAVE